MSESNKSTVPVKLVGQKETGEAKIGRNPVTFDADHTPLRKPDWIRVRIPPGNAVQRLKANLRAQSLVTVCEEASCPNILSLIHI